MGRRARISPVAVGLWLFRLLILASMGRGVDLSPERLATAGLALGLLGLWAWWAARCGTSDEAWPRCGQGQRRRRDWARRRRPSATKL